MKKSPRACRKQDQLVRLSLKPCGDCWLHVNAPSGLKASINLGQRGGFHDQTIAGMAIREVAQINEDVGVEKFLLDLED